jgi:hypothetical protein
VRARELLATAAALGHAEATFELAVHECRMSAGATLPPGGAESAAHRRMREAVALGHAPAAAWLAAVDDQTGELARREAEVARGREEEARSRHEEVQRIRREAEESGKLEVLQRIEREAEEARREAELKAKEEAERLARENETRHAQAPPGRSARCRRSGVRSQRRPSPRRLRQVQTVGSLVSVADPHELPSPASQPRAPGQVACCALATPASGPGSPRPHRRRDRAPFYHI